MSPLLKTILLAGVLAVCLSAAGCSRPAAGTATKSDATAAPAAATPPGVCTAAERQSTPRSGRATIVTFLSVFNRRRDLSRGWLAPETTLQIMGGLAPITRLELVSLDHHY